MSSDVEKRLSELEKRISALERRIIIIADRLQEWDDDDEDVVILDWDPVEPLGPLDFLFYII